jgi:hypothetical protein
VASSSRHGHLPCANVALGKAIHRIRTVLIRCINNRCIAVVASTFGFSPLRQRWSHRSYSRRLLKQSPQVPQPALAERLKLPRVKGCHWLFERVEQTAPIGGYSRSDHSPIDRFAGPPCEVTLFEAVDEPSHIRVSYRRPLSHCAQRRSSRPRIPENPQDVVLLGRDTARLEQRRELVHELTRKVLEQEVDLPLGCLHRFESPRASYRIPLRWAHARVRRNGECSD